MREMYKNMGICDEVYDYCDNIIKSLHDRFEEIDKNAEYNQMKVIKAMQDEKVAEMHLSGTTGYGYNDDGRDTLEKIYSDIFKTEDALVRPQIICGTHALNVALSSNLRPGDELLSPVGKPYDTMDEIIGIRPSKGSLAEYGITYAQVDLLPDGGFDYEGIKNAINERTKLVTIQRSKGYASRPTLSVERIGELISFIKSIKPDVICMVDNCYGEFVERIEPSEVGADMIVGSLIKNPGGGLAPCGGYIAGKKECVEQAAYRLSSPGLGKEVGATLGVNQSFYQGLFLSPVVVAGALKGAIFAANVYEKAGFVVRPDGSEPRYDIIQAVELGSADGLLAFCKGIQAAAPEASSKLGSDGSGYTLVKSLGHSVVPVVPALVQLKVKDFAFQKASGVRTDAKVTALINGRMAASDTGELQITNYGISGIPVFQVSRYISRALYEKKMRRL